MSVKKNMTFDDFVGNEQTVGNLKLLAESAKAKDGILPHIGFFGPPGHGKTTLAAILADYVDREFVYINSTAVRSPLTLRGVILHPDNLRKGAVVLLDECHRLPSSIQDNMLSVLEYPAVLVTSYKDQIIRDNLPSNISFIFATTHQGLLRDALLSRLEILELHEYSTEQKQIIALKYLIRQHKMKPESLDLDTVMEIGRRSRSGRHVVKFCDNIVRYMEAKNINELTPEVANEVFEVMGVDHNGLTKRDKLLLSYVRQSGGCGLDTLEAYLNVPKKDIKDKLEPFLLRRGLIVRQSSGRAITQRGMDALDGVKINAFD